MAAAWRTFILLLFLGIAPAHAQDPGTLNPEPLPPLQDPNSPKIPARELFARKTTPLPGPPQSIGSYADGCLAGAVALPTTASSWQVMRVSRNRFWGNPNLIDFIKRLADSGKRVGLPQKRLRETRMTCQDDPVAGNAIAPTRQPSAYDPIDCGGPGSGVVLRGEQLFRRNLR